MFVPSRAHEMVSVPMCIADGACRGRPPAQHGTVPLDGAADGLGFVDIAARCRAKSATGPAFQLARFAAILASRSGAVKGSPRLASALGSSGAPAPLLIRCGHRLQYVTFCRGTSCSSAQNGGRSPLEPLQHYSSQRRTRHPARNTKLLQNPSIGGRIE